MTDAILLVAAVVGACALAWNLVRRRARGPRLTVVLDGPHRRRP